MKKKKIVIEYCQTCPLEGKCSAWDALTAKQRFAAFCGVGVPTKFLLSTCPLEDDNEIN